MPQVPVYGDRQLRTQALQPVMQQTPDVSSGARALGQGLMQVAEVADRIDLRDSQAKANEVDTQLTRDWNKWEDDNRGKFTNQSADGYTKAVDAWWKEAAKTYGKDLNGRSQAMVGQTLGRRQTVALEQAGKYEFVEKEKYADSTTAAAINTATINALKTGDYEGEAQRVRNLVDEQGLRKNWNKEQRDAERNARMGMFNTAVVAQLAEKDAAQAQQYLTGAIDRGEIRPDQQPRLESIIKGEADNQFATQTAAAMAGKPLSEQLAEAAKITDPQRREKTLNQVRNNYALVKQAQQEQEKQFSDQAWQLVGKGQKVPETILSGMDGKERVQLQEHLRARAERLAAGKPVKTNPVALANVYDMMRDDPEGFKKLRMAALTETFAPNDIEQISRIQRDMLKPNTEKDVATTTQLIGVYTGGYKPEKKSAFSDVFFDEINKLEKEKGRSATYDEKRKIGDRLIIDGEVLSGSMFLNDPNKKYYEATPEERTRFAPTITSGDRKLVKDALMAEGVKNPTEAQILERFKLAKGFR
jgi:hypothetical protein